MYKVEYTIKFNPPKAWPSISDVVRFSTQSKADQFVWDLVQAWGFGRVEFSVTQED